MRWGPKHCRYWCRCCHKHIPGQLSRGGRKNWQVLHRLQACRSELEGVRAQYPRAVLGLKLRADRRGVRCGSAHQRRRVQEGYRTHCLILNTFGHNVYIMWAIQVGGLGELSLQRITVVGRQTHLETGKLACHAPLRADILCLAKRDDALAGKCCCLCNVQCKTRSYSKKGRFRLAWRCWPALVVCRFSHVREPSVVPALVPACVYLPVAAGKWASFCGQTPAPGPALFGTSDTHVSEYTDVSPYKGSNPGSSAQFSFAQPQEHTQQDKSLPRNARQSHTSRS